MSGTGFIDLDLLNENERSATFWSSRLPKYSATMRRRADGLTIAATVLSTLTGLAIWGTIAASTAAWAQVLVGFVAIAAAVAAALPKVIGYSDCAATAAKLSGQYGKVYAEVHLALAAAAVGDPRASEYADTSIRDFTSTRLEKNALNPFPTDLQDERDAEEKLAKEKLAKQVPATATPVPSLPGSGRTGNP